MSVVPNEKLISADSLDLITFGIDVIITDEITKLDVFTRYRAFWKSAVIRNTQLSDSLSYRTDPNSEYKTVQPNSELPIRGWGSYFEIVSDAETPDGIVEFELVNMNNAMRKNA